MLNDTVFLTLAEVIKVHLDQIQHYGGIAGIRDTELLESALAMPEASFGGERLHVDLFEMAAAYAFHICRNHPFIDGNSRTSRLLMLHILRSHNLPALELPLGYFDLYMNLTKLSKKRDDESFKYLIQEIVLLNLKRMNSVL